MSLIHDPALHQLRHRLRGSVHDPGTPEYDEACTLFNARVERRPRHIVRASRPHHVAAALEYAALRGLRVAVRGGGHSVAGLSLVDDGIVIDVRGFREITVDPERRVVRAGAGLTWGELDAATQAHGLAAVGGRVSTTGVAGLALGGGSGWLERKHGLASDNILAVELVTARGDEVRATADEHPELFWALRGGGGNFGVVTAIEFALHPVGPEVLGGLLLHPAERGRELLRRFRDVMDDAPDELSLAFVYLNAPDEDGIPAELRGRQAVAIAGMYAGPIEEAERALAPLRDYGPPALDAFGPVRYADFQRSIDDPPGYRNWWTAEYLDDLSDDAIEAIASLSEQLPPGPAQIFIPAWGGAVARASADAGPLAKREARYVVHPLLLWSDAADDERMIAFGRRYRDVLAPHRTGGTYLNFLGDEGADRVRAAYGPHYDRLARVKAGWDPDNVFRATGNVRPAD
jgi:FAD/FMN-containing dehydrogenase